MLFLKRVEAYGFKSFARPTKLDFDNEMTGIVGPNGSGKSNITDAIRWALGEQSSKSLRGDNMDDIVFSGSDSHPSLNVAEVTLIFDNKNRVFNNLDFDEVEVTRRFFKQTKESEFFINKARVRLKDVQDIALETGLTKSSLAIISQGSVNSFVESKPEDRRMLFDEAAGVSIYKRRKQETERKLFRARENLNRLNDIANEIERKLPSLKRQATKAKIYAEKSSKLRDIEVAILVKDINAYKETLTNLNNELNSFSTMSNDLKKELQINQSDINSLQSQIKSIDKSIAYLNDDFTKIVENIANLKVKKASLDNKRPVSQSSDVDNRLEQLLLDYNNNNLTLEHEEQNIQNQQNQYDELKNANKNTTKELEQAQENLGRLQRNIARLELEIEQAQRNTVNDDSLHAGVKSILENKDSLSGVEGIVRELISVDSKYEQAIITQLQSALQFIVMKTTKDVEYASNFLKQNNAGVATFLPLDNLRVNTINDEDKFIIESADGFVAYANNLIKIDKKHAIINDYLLANVIVMEDFKTAAELAKLTRNKFNLVTLEGERFLPRGAIVGGRKRTKNKNYINSASALSDLQKNLELLNEQEQKSRDDINIIKQQDSQQREMISQLQALIGATKANIENLHIDLQEIKDEYQLLSGKEIDGEGEALQLDQQVLKISQEILAAESKKTDIQQKLNVERSLREKISASYDELNEQFNERRAISNQSSEKLVQLKTDIARIEEKLNQANNRLAQNYNLTYQSALELDNVEYENEQEVRELIKKLHQEIQELGNVNVDSIEEYTQEQERFDNFQEQIFDANSSITNLQSVIKDMDAEMLKKFNDIVNSVNKVLPETFGALFGGGKASIYYTNPDDILNSGIEIKINPPGKKIQNLNLLSGGEKSMVALSVLFSILKVKPLPLVILDEVEAPLDPSNVERFSHYLKGFVLKTQFLIVTHRSGTMENCDVLYGVTMQQKGVTEILRIKLNEANNFTKIT